jgi:dTMP kinase
MAPGRFIVIEGPDGSGSTTQVAMLAATLRERGRSVVTTREPSAGPVGALLRQILGHRLVHNDGTPIGESELALLFAADRLDHLANEIDPALLSGADVISDRYLLSTLAYQSQAEDTAWLVTLNRRARMPDLTIVLDVPAEESMRRIQATRPRTERYERVELLAAIHATFLRLAAAADSTYPGRTVIVRGTQPPDVVHAAIVRAVERLPA